MLSSRTLRPILAAFVGTVLLTPAPFARADFQVSFTDQKTGATKTINAYNGDLVSVTVGNFTITGTLTLINSGTSVADIAFVNAGIKNNSGSADTLTFKESATFVTSGIGFTSEPLGSNLSLLSTAAGLVGQGTLLSMDFTSYVDTSNKLFDLNGAIASPQFKVSNVKAGNNFSSGSDTVNFGTSLNYSVTNVADYQLSGGGALALGGGLGQVDPPALPEPSSLLLVALALPMLATYWLRRPRPQA